MSTKILDIKPASDEFAVVGLSSTGKRYCRQPCPECPWRKDVKVGTFPAEAYRLSAPTAYDMSKTTFACHMAGAEAAAICAGFILRARHNLTIRLMIAFNELLPMPVTEVELYDDYRAMAIANGVSPGDERIARCR